MLGLEERGKWGRWRRGAEGKRRKEEVRGRRDEGEERSREGERAEEEKECERERSGAFYHKLYDLDFSPRNLDWTYFS